MCPVSFSRLVRSWSDTSFRIIILLVSPRKDTFDLAPLFKQEPVDKHKRCANEASNGSKPFIREDSNENSPRKTEHGSDDGNTPLRSIKSIRDNLESPRALEDDDDLETNHEEGDEDKELVALDALEDVELIVEAAVVEHVEYLHPDKGVEDDGVEFSLLPLDGGVVAEDLVAGKVEDKGDGELIDGLADDHLPHLGIAC